MVNNKLTSPSEITPPSEEKKTSESSLRSSQAGPRIKLLERIEGLGSNPSLSQSLGNDECQLQGLGSIEPRVTVGVVA